jgi:hypothetical protein
MTKVERWEVSQKIAMILQHRESQFMNYKRERGKIDKR